ncbi:MAG: putative serine protease PepD [Streptomyces sp.]|nr:putative serine protease PepD [Streptomyces sp.]
MSVGKAAGPQWWSRPDPTAGPGPEPAAPPAAPEPVDTAPEPVEAAPEPVQAAPEPVQAALSPVPRHTPDPYDTPPYGPPGPWAPAPPVQPLSVGQWRPYDPWTPPQPSPGRRRGRTAAGLLAVALAAGVLGGAAGAYVRSHNGDGGSRVSLPQATASASARPAERAPDSIAGIAARTLPGVVYIHVKTDSGEATGTGFVLDGQGHILTNNHVVESATSGGISVTFNNGQVIKNAAVTGRDSGYDLAVIKVSGATGLRPLTLGDSDAVRVGDPVVAIGAPYDLEGTVTSGIISATHRPITAGGQTDGTDVSYVDALQTDAPINPGNSGGPLVDAGGLVIGINSAIRSADSGSDPFGGSSQGGSIGLGFSIPINQAKLVAEELISTGKATHPVIGVSVNMQYGGDGAQVSEEVTKGGPGDRAGIRKGDVITAIDGKRVHSGAELIVRIRSHRPGDHLTLTLTRDGEQQTVGLTLGSSTGS